MLDISEPNIRTLHRKPINRLKFKHNLMFFFFFQINNPCHKLRLQRSFSSNSVCAHADASLYISRKLKKKKKIILSFRVLTDDTVAI